MVCVEGMPGGLFFLLAFFRPESPRWLATKGRFGQAVCILTKTGGKVCAEQTISELRALSGREERRENWSALFDMRIRFILIVGIVLAVFQQWCGINVIFNLPTGFLQPPVMLFLIFW